MIRSKVRGLAFEKGVREKRKITYQVIQDATGLAASTVSRLMSREPVKAIDGKTLDALCDFFGVGVGDILEHVQDGQEGTL